MLLVRTAEGLGPLVDALVEVLHQPLDDPFAPEWIAVATAGHREWLRLQLAAHLGTSTPSRRDGVAANISMELPNTLRRVVLDGHRAHLLGVDAVNLLPDPWTVDRLMWDVLDALHDAPAASPLAPIASVPLGASLLTRSRRLADLFDRYIMRRPAMLRSWSQGRRVDGTGGALLPSLHWQAELWQQLEGRVTEPSAVHRLPDALELVRSGQITLELPPRISLFGFSTLPGGAAFTTLAEAVSHQHHVHVFLVTPSAGASRRTAERRRSTAATPSALRSSDTAHTSDGHPLNRSWGRPARETALLLADAEAAAVWPRGEVIGTPLDSPHRVRLQRLQASLSVDSLPPPVNTHADHVDHVDHADRSIVFHSCHGPSRQVEVLRDEILHRLACDPTLREEEIVVLCPDLATFGPLVEAIFGPSSDSAPSPEAPHHVSGAPLLGPPALRYRLTDRTLRDTFPTFKAMERLIALLGSRFEVSAVLDFVSLPPVRERFNLDDDAIATIARWVADAGVTWGLDGVHRQAQSIPGEFDAGTWRVTLDRLLLGVATTDDGASLAPAHTLPIDVEGDGVVIIGRFTDLIERLARLAHEAQATRTIGEWCTWLTDTSAEMLAAPFDASWQLTRLQRIFTQIRQAADDAPRSPSPVPITLADVERLLAVHLHAGGHRPDFFRGGIAVGSLGPLRGLPYRMVCVLGLDDRTLSNPPADGDDLLGAAPLLGDPDPRGESRQHLLQAVLSATEHLVVTHTGHSVVTNEPVPPCTAMSELLDATLAEYTPAARTSARDALVTVHPRQGFDPRNFISGDVVDGRPWGFDPVALLGAEVRTTHDPTATPPPPAPFLSTPLPKGPDRVVDLADLRSVLENPVKAFLRNQLNVRIPDRPTGGGGSGGSGPGGGGGGSEIRTELVGLDQWKVADRLLDALLRDLTYEQWFAREEARGALPPGVLRAKALDGVRPRIEAMALAARVWGYEPTPPTPEPIDLVLPSGYRLVGAVTVFPASETHPAGPVRVTTSKWKPTQMIASCLDLLALIAKDPTVEWHAVHIGQSTSTRRPPPPAIRQFLPPDADEPLDPAARHAVAVAALDVAVTLHQQARTEPLPLFPTLSHALANAESKPKNWRDSYSGVGDADKPDVDAVFGLLTYTELLRLPTLPHDPDGPGVNRAERFAHLLWGTLQQTCRIAQR